MQHVIRWCIPGVFLTNYVHCIVFQGTNNRCLAYQEGYWYARTRSEMTPWFRIEFTCKDRFSLFRPGSIVTLKSLINEIYACAIYWEAETSGRSLFTWLRCEISHQSKIQQSGRTRAGMSRSVMALSGGIMLTNRERPQEGTVMNSRLYDIM